MKRLFVANDVKLVGVKASAEKGKKIDYYVSFPGHQQIYAFTRKYTNNAYKFTKAGVRINDLLTMRSRDSSVMSLVKYTKYMLDYLV